jgi:hypothetical protein
MILPHFTALSLKAASHFHLSSHFDVHTSLVTLTFLLTRMMVIPYAPPSPPSDNKVELIYNSSSEPSETLTQLPSTISDRLIAAGITLETAERLITQFNRVSFPIIPDRTFTTLLAKAFANSKPEKFIDNFKEEIDKINSKLDQEVESVRGTILNQLFSENLSDGNLSAAIDLLALQSLHGVKSFIVGTLPTMVAAWTKETLPEANTGCAGVTCNTHITECQSIPNTQSASRRKPRTPPSPGNQRTSQRIAQQNLLKNKHRIRKRPVRRKKQ